MDKTYNTLGNEGRRTASWTAESSLFSYSLVPLFGSKKLQIEINQQETNFSIYLTIKHQEQKLQITQFTLNEASDLREISQGLYEAALIDLMVQALDFIYFYSQQQSIKKTVFILQAQEAAHLIPFEGFFDNSSALSLQHGPSILLYLPTVLKNYTIFKNQITEMDIKIRQNLWYQQREDAVLKQYLQGNKNLEELGKTQRKFQPLSGKILRFPNKMVRKGLV